MTTEEILVQMKLAENALALIRLGLEPPASKVGHIVGLNGASVPSRAVEIRALGIKSDRIVFAPESTSYEGVNLATSKGSGFTNQTVVVGNVMDTTLLANVNISSNTMNTVAQAKAAELLGGVAVLEFMNEPQFKGGAKNPLRYAELYLSAKQGMAAAGCKLPLGFTIFGDYQRADGTWSQVSAGAGWTADAVRAFPQLTTQVDALIHHTYGRLNENAENNTGTAGLEAELKSCESLGLLKPLYITEYGIQIGTTKSATVAISETEQAQVITNVGKKCIELGAKGLWPYAVLDGAWSLKPQALKAAAKL